jgi:integrase
MITLSDRLNEYKKRSHLRESSIEILDRSAKWFIELHGDLDPGNVTFGQIDDYKSWLLKGRSESAANTYLRVFRPLWSWMAKRGYIKYNPFDGVKLYQICEKKFDVYSFEEIERILTISSNLWRTIICLGLCGMRKSEILNLVISDISFDNNRLLITPKKKTEYTWLWDIKDHNQAYVGFDDTVNKLLKSQIESLKGTNQPYVCLKQIHWERNIELNRQDRLPHTLRNDPWGGFTRDFRQLQRRALIKKLKRFHDLRGTFATERYAEGYGIKELQYLMRHSSIETTARYIHNFDDKLLVKKSGESFSKKYTEKLQLGGKTE